MFRKQIWDFRHFIIIFGGVYTELGAKDSLELKTVSL